MSKPTNPPAPAIDSPLTGGGAVTQLTHTTTPPVPAHAQKPAPTNDAGQTPGQIKTSVEPAAPTVQEKPIPVLSQHGFWGGIDEFNNRVQAVHDQFTQAYGHAPSPGLTFDLAKSNVDPDQFGKMFTVPQDPTIAKNRGIAVQHGYDPESPVIVSAKHVAQGILNAATTGDYHDYLASNEDLIHQLSYESKAGAAAIAGAIFKARRFTLQKDIDEKVAAGEMTATEGTQELRDAGYLPGSQGVFKVPTGIAGEAAIAIGQVTDSLVHSPAGLYELGKAAGLDTADAYHGDFAFTRSRAVAKAVALQTVHDFEHPLANPGYLFLDALGLASAGAGVVVRTDAALGAIGEAGEGASSAAKAGAAAKALARKPGLQRATVTYGDASEEMPLSQNPLVAAAQKGILKVREAGAEKAAARAGEVGPLRSVLLPDTLNELLDTQLTIPKKLGREADARKRVDHIAQTTLQRELDAVAGRSVTRAKVLSRLPGAAQKGLTRGEQKAIQVMATDDPTPLETERAFHQRMIEMGVGDPKAHRAQIANLKLAENALANPSPRFLHALDLTRQTVAEMERMKIADLGLLPETAEGRVAKIGALLRDEDIVRLEGEGGQFKQLRTTDKSKPVDVVPLERENPDSFYLPTQSARKAKRGPSDRAGYYATKAGPFGVPLGRPLAELTHEFTGKAIKAGDYRIDATALASEAYARTVRAVTIRAEHERLWNAATDEPRTRFDVPIRDANLIPDKLRKVISRLDEGDVTQAEAELLPDDMRELLTELYPKERALTDEPIEGVKWIDARMLGEGNTVPYTPGMGAKVGNLINAPFRFFSLYARPAYILNKLGNQAMLVFDQGVVSTARNMVRAMAGDDLYGEENMRTVRALVGSSRSRSYVTSNASRVGQSVAEFWNRVADRDERVASFIHYADLKGYTTKDDYTRLLNDSGARADLSEITRRANKALVEFDNLTPIEKNYIRHWVFVYPWVSRSAVWSIRAVLDHPGKTAILSHLGRVDMTDDPLYGNVVSWVKRVGYVPLGWHNGNPAVVNPSSVNTFSTVGDFLALTRAATEGDKYSSLEDFLGPLPRYFIHASTGRDEFGTPYPGSQWWDAAKEVLAGLPQVTAYDRGSKKAVPDKPVNVGSRSSLVSSFNASLKKTVLSPGWLDGYGSLLVGGLSPRDLNIDAATARYWNDQDPKVKHQRELGLLNRALDMQGEVLQQSVPTGVRSAVRDQSNITQLAQQFQKQTGRAPTDKERTRIAIDYLSSAGAIPKGSKAKLNGKLEGLVDPHDIAVFRNALINKYMYGKQLRDWDTDIRTVASFTPDVFNAKVAKLNAQGLDPQKRYQVDQEKLYDYGRKYVAFTHEAKKLQADIKTGAKTEADLRAFQDAHDVPVDGLPSFVRMAWANQTPADQTKHVEAITTGSWGSLSSFDKTLLGRPTSPAVSAGRDELDKLVTEQRKQVAREGGTFPASHTRTLAQYVERYYDTATGKFESNPKTPPTGLVKDYDFGKQPVFARMKFYAPIQKSPNHGQWVQLLNIAKDMHAYLAATDANGTHVYKATQVRQMWSDYVHGVGFQSWLGEHPGFRTEIDSYGKTFLNGLIG